MNIILGLLIPFLGTFIGSSLVFFIKKTINKKFEVIILSFSAGIMLVASIWSLLIPSLNMVKGIKLFIPFLGFALGIMTFFLLDLLFFSKTENKYSIFTSMSIHNIPEGITVGIVLAGLMTGNNFITTGTLLALVISIAIQNIPDGLIVSIPLYNKGLSKNKAFLLGILSGFIEMLGAISSILFLQIINLILPLLLSYAAGVMFYVIISSIIPESKTDNNIHAIGFMFGFIIMLILEVVTI